jgi:hypothetical protein
MTMRSTQRNDAVRSTNDWVGKAAVDDPVNRSQLSPICGSSEKPIAIAACGLTKCARIRVMSASPSTVADIDVLALGASIMTRIQASFALDAAIRVEVATTLPGPWGPLAATVSIVVAAARLRGADAGRKLWGIGALAETVVARSTRELGAGA